MLFKPQTPRKLNFLIRSPSRHIGKLQVPLYYFQKGSVVYFERRGRHIQGRPRRYICSANYQKFVVRYLLVTYKQWLFFACVCFNLCLFFHPAHNWLWPDKLGFFISLLLRFRQNRMDDNPRRYENNKFTVGNVFTLEPE